VTEGTASRDTRAGSAPVPTAHPRRSNESRREARAARLANVAALLPAPLLWLLTVRTGYTLNLFESGTVLAGGQHLVHGDMLYTDVFAFYGPLAYLGPYLMAALFGRSDLALLLPDVIFGTLVCWIAYRLAVRLSGRPWLSLLVPMAIAAQGADSRRTLPALASLLALSNYERTRARWWLFLSGIACAAATLWFQDAGISLAISLVVVTAVAMHRWRPALGGTVRSAGSWVLGFLGLMLPFAVALAVVGALSKWLYYCFVFPNTTYAHRSATGYLQSLIASWSGLSLPRLIYKYAFYIAPYALVAVVAFTCVLVTVYALVRRRAVTAVPLTAAALSLYALLQLRVVFASLDEAKLVHASPPTIVAAVGLAGWLTRRTRSRAAPRLERAARAGFVVATSFLLLVASQKQIHYRLHLAAPPLATGRGLLSGIPLAGAAPPATTVPELSALTEYVDAHTTARDRIFVAPTQPLLYYLTGRDNATGYDYLDPVYTTPAVDTRIVSQLATRKPALVLLADSKFGKLSGPELAPKTYLWLTRHYRTVRRIGAFRILAPHG
jgi:hypothetical protein